jgi:predicted DNA-binding transcriptional regulator AlpA
MVRASERPRLGTVGAAVDQSRTLNLTANPSLATSIEPLVTKADLERILQIDSRTIDRMRATGKLPKPDLFLSRMPRWKAETIRAWIEAGGRS